MEAHETFSKTFGIDPNSPGSALAIRGAHRYVATHAAGILNSSPFFAQDGYLPTAVVLIDSGTNQVQRYVTRLMVDTSSESPHLPLYQCQGHYFVELPAARADFLARVNHLREAATVDSVDDTEDVFDSSRVHGSYFVPDDPQHCADCAHYRPLMHTCEAYKESHPCKAADTVCEKYAEPCPFCHDPECNDDCGLDPA